MVRYLNKGPAKIIRDYQVRFGCSIMAGYQPPTPQLQPASFTFKFTFITCFCVLLQHLFIYLANYQNHYTIKTKRDQIVLSLFYIVKFVVLAMWNSQVITCLLSFFLLVKTRLVEYFVLTRFEISIFFKKRGKYCQIKKLFVCKQFVLN